MPLILSASGLRGTVEGSPGENLTPLEVVQWVGAWGQWLRERYGPTAVLVGRDSRPSGSVLQPIAIHTLRALGHKVWEAGLVTTPTLAMGVPFLGAAGALMITASHNPAGWNALKFLDERGEFLPPETLQEIATHRAKLRFPATDAPPPPEEPPSLLAYHVERLLQHPLVERRRIAQCGLQVVVDGINSGGAIALPLLLEALGVAKITVLNGTPDGRFAHPPEPLPENLTQLAQEVRQKGAHLGIATDPDGDRVAFLMPDGTPFGEEYTLVAVADYVLGHQPGPVVANLSTTAAVRWVAAQHNAPFYESPVGEYHVVQKMRAVGAVIGGEGNGGIIWPALHYGRDALVGVALFLSHLCRFGGDMQALRNRYPKFHMIKARLPLSGTLPQDFWEKVQAYAGGGELNWEDGCKVSWKNRWIHIRPSGTEPLLRLIVEAPTVEEAEALAAEWMERLRSWTGTA
ncbi:MAG: phosphoglucosamine mutase [Bacteroidia bacterium]|nr:phosphoglucosamine mutase [Bacteroidia bacterium]MDW8089511.1 phosphoglucosamine mutase [Bacteroidia bacterium]